MRKLLWTKRWLALAIFAGALGMGLASPAQAQFRMRVESVLTGQGVVITDNGGGDINPDVGIITFSGPIGGFVINVTTGVSKPILGGVLNYAELDLNSVNVLTTGPGTLRLSLEDNGYTLGPAAPSTLTVRGDVGGVLSGPAGSTININSWADGTNAVPSYGASGIYTVPASIPALGPIPGTAVNAFGPGGVNFLSGPFSTTGSAPFLRTGAAYSLFAQVTVTFTGPGSVSFNDNQQVVPAPGGLILLLSGAPVAGIAYLRRRFFGAA